MNNSCMGFYPLIRNEETEKLVKGFALSLLEHLSTQNQWQKYCGEKQRIGLLKQLQLVKQEEYGTDVRNLRVNRIYSENDEIWGNTRIRFVFQNGVYQPKGSLEERFKLMGTPEEPTVQQTTHEQGTIYNSAVLMHKGDKPLDLLIVNAVTNFIEQKLAEYNERQKKINPRHGRVIAYESHRF